MKKLFVILAMLMAMNASGQWVQMNGMEPNQIVNTFKDNGSLIYAGTYFGLYISSDNGANWNYNFLNIPVLSIAVNGNCIFAGTTISGVYSSTNNGFNWTQTSLNNQFICSMISKDNIVFAGTQDSGVYSSSDNGNTWTRNSLNNRRVMCFAKNEQYIYAGTYGFGIYRSSNNGLNWTQCLINVTNSVYAIALSGNKIYAGLVDIYNTSERGIYMSVNNGDSWNYIGLYSISVRSLAVTGNELYAGTVDNGIYYTSNSGYSWRIKNQGFNNLPTVSAFLIKDYYILSGTWGYSVWKRNLAGITSEMNSNTVQPYVYSLSQNYPNPFNPMCNVQFSMCKAGNVKLVVYDLMGREVKTLVNERLNAGTYETTFDGSQLSSGVYFYKLVSDGFTETKRMILIK